MYVYGWESLQSQIGSGLASEIALRNTRDYSHDQDKPRMRSLIESSTRFRTFLWSTSGAPMACGCRRGAHRARRREGAHQEPAVARVRVGLLPPLRFTPLDRCSSPALARAPPGRSASSLALPLARSASTMAAPTTFPSISCCRRRHNVIGRATHRVSENRTPTKISQDSGQRLN